MWNKCFCSVRIELIQLFVFVIDGVRVWQTHAKCGKYGSLKRSKLCRSVDRRIVEEKTRGLIVILYKLLLNYSVFYNI